MSKRLRKEKGMSRSGNKNYENRIITVPNILSLFRLCLIPVIVWLYCFREDYILTVVVVGISGITDIVDGFIARKFNMISNVGKIFDPIADKLTQIAIMACLLTKFGYMIIPLIIFIIKEVTMGVAALVMVKKTKVISGANWHGKVSTVMFFALVAVHLIWYNIPTPVSIVFIALSTSMMVLSASLYTVGYVKAIKNQK